MFPDSSIKGTGDKFERTGNAQVDRWEWQANCGDAREEERD